MEKRKIGSLDVTVVGLGCNNFGRRLDLGQTELVVNAAIDSGINFLDTADIYGGTKSEEFLGQVLKGKRDKVVLATKFGMEVAPDKKGAKPEYIRQAAEDSLRRLETDYIDLYQIHAPDPTVPIADTLGALDELVKAGKVREIGCSNFSVAQLQEAAAAVKSGNARFESVQNHYSLLYRDNADEVLAECARQSIGFLPYFPLASGLLTGKYRKGQQVPSGTRIAADSDSLSDANLDKVEALIAFSERNGHDILKLAVSWLLAKPQVSSVIAGATKVEQVHANVSGAGWNLTKEQLDEVDGILKG